jgi:mitogen-activated protein kinase 1/3
MGRANAMMVRQISSKVKGKAQFECKDGLITVDLRYDVIKQVGSGAYGHVFSAKDKNTGQEVAIKRIHKAFEDVIDAKRVLREIKILSKYYFCLLTLFRVF